MDQVKIKQNFLNFVEKMKLKFLIKYISLGTSIAFFLSGVRGAQYFDNRQD